MEPPNYDSLTDQQLIQLSAENQVDISDIVPQSDVEPQVAQEGEQQFTEEQLNKMSDQELLALDSKRKETEQEKPKGLLRRAIDKGLELQGATFRSGMRGVESIAGKPGEIQDLLEGLGISESITRGVSGIKFPTSKDLREGEKELFGDVLEPKGPIEEFAGETTADTADLFLSVGPIKGLSLIRSLGLSFGGNLVKQGLIQGFDVDEGKADLIKLPIYLLGSGRFGPNKQKFINESWEKVNNLVKGRVVTDNSLVNKLKGFSNQLQKGGLTGQQGKVLEKVQGLLKRIESGTFEFDELTEANKVINEGLRDFKTFDKNGRALLQGYKKIIVDAVESNGTPDLAKAWKEANLASSALGAQNSLVEAAKRMLKKTDLSPTTQAILTFTFPQATTAVAVTKLVQDRVSLMSRIMENPQARKFYLEALEGLISNKASVAIKNAKKLDAFIKRSEGIGVDLL